MRKEKSMKKLIRKRKKECSGNNFLTFMRWLESFIKNGMRDGKEKDPKFTRKVRDHQEGTMMKKNQRRAMEEM